MKHLRPFNEACWSTRLRPEIQDILNLARDEGLMVRSVSVGNRGNYSVWIYRFPWTDEGLQYNQPPILSNDVFIEMVKGIYERLDSDDIIVYKDTENVFFGRWDTQEQLYKIPIISDDQDREVGYARLLVNNA